MESQRPDALIKDEKAVALVTSMSYDFNRIRQVKMDEDDKGSFSSGPTTSAWPSAGSASAITGGSGAARHTISNLNAVSQTLLIPLYFRAMESQRPDALVRDPKAVELIGQLDYDFSGVQRLRGEQVNYLLRMREFDRLARAFLAEHPDAVIVDLGCGLDTRFERVDNGQAEWYGLDLPEVIELRKELLDETPRSHFIGCSVLDFSWMDAVSGQAGKRGQPGWPFLFLAEAMLVYLEEADVKRLVQALAERFPGAELVCEAYSPVVVRFHPRPPVVARPRWGLKDDRDVEAWAPGIRLLSQWYYFDKPEPRQGAFQIMRHLPFFARVVRIVHYRLGEKEPNHEA